MGVQLVEQVDQVLDLVVVSSDVLVHGLRADAADSLTDFIRKSATLGCR